MANQLNPYLRRVGGYDADGNAPPDTSSAPTDAAQAAADTLRGGSGSGGGTPQTGPAPATPTLVAPGTQVGSALRTAGQQFGNFETASANRLSRAVTGGVNALSKPLRTATGFGEDVIRGVVGASPRADAGTTPAGYTAPQLSMPYPGGADAPAAASPAPNAPVTPSTLNLQDASAVGRVVAPLLQPLLSTFGPGAPRAAATPQPAAASPAPGASAAAPSGATPNNGSPVGGVDIGGRHVNIGAMVNGVPTFSDGSAGMPQTVDKAGMAQLAQERSISRADQGAAGNVLASDVLGSTPSTSQQVATLVRNANVPITGSRPTAQQFADADRLNALSMDPRSAAGTVTHNLAMEAQYGTNVAARRNALNSLAQLNAGVNQSGVLAQQGEQQQELSDQQGRNALATTALQGHNQLANTALQGRDAIATARAQLQMPHKGVQVTLNDGTLGLQDPVTGVITRSTLPDGTVAKGQLKNPLPPIYTSQGGQKALSELTNNILGVDPVSGMIHDANAPGGQRLPSNAEQFAAMQKAQQQLQQLGGAQGGPAAGATPSVDAFLDAARKANPGVSDADLRNYYQKKYGKAA